MTMIRKLIAAQISDLGEREVEVVMSTAALARDGHILIPQGCLLENYRANPIVLWSHDANEPIGTVEQITVSGDEITARVCFAPLGISPTADRICGLTKAAVIRAVSVGFDPIESEPLEPTKPKGGQRISAWELLELSFVSVPADAGALVTARQHDGGNSMKVEEGQAAPAPAMTRAKRVISGQRVALLAGKRGLYQLASLCYLFEDLGCKVDSAKYESAIEGDGSKVPAMLAGVLHDLGDALLAMAAEEVAEALAGYDVEPEDDDDDDVILTVDDRAYVRAGATPRVRAFRRAYAYAKARAGKTLSTDTVRCLREMKAQHEEAITEGRSAIAKHKKALGTLDDMMNRAGVSQDDDEDSTGGKPTEAQTSVGDATIDGDRAASDFRRRQADMLSLSLTA
ncbi:MAG: HK97 family phage prohead protease [Sphingomonadales bacterium]|nr:HK97 family phage prohead protease [Sphingomonadales bacterium]MDE2171184.1 HK97 family phage prohead protease [Sphingomonadales bacterium]